MLFLLFGSSASGKTTLVDDVAGRVDRIEGHDFDEIGVPAGADTAWRHRAYGTWIDRALELRLQGVDLLLCGQTPLGEVLASPRAAELDAIAACLADCDDATRAARLDGRGAEWFARSAGSMQDHLNWADWLRGHARDPQWMQHVIRIPETESEMRWDRWCDWQAGDPRWRVHTIDTSRLDRGAAADELARWIEAERAAVAS